MTTNAPPSPANDAVTPGLIPLTLALMLALIVSGLSPFDRTTWAMEVAPVVIALPLTQVLYQRGAFTAEDSFATAIALALLPLV